MWRLVIWLGCRKSCSRVQIAIKHDARPSCCLCLWARISPFSLTVQVGQTSYLPLSRCKWARLPPSLSHGASEAVGVPLLVQSLHPQLISSNPWATPSTRGSVRLSIATPTEELPCLHVEPFSWHTEREKWHFNRTCNHDSCRHVLSTCISNVAAKL